MTSEFKSATAAACAIVTLWLAACSREPARPLLQDESQNPATPAAASAGSGSTTTVSSIPAEIPTDVTPATIAPAATGNSAGAALTPSIPEQAVAEVLDATTLAAHQMEVDRLCASIGDKLSSVDTAECLDQLFRFGGGYSVNQKPLIFKDYTPERAVDKAFRVLIMGGIHGDEYSSISIIFKWLALFKPQGLEGEFHWRFIPLVNPDGLLDGNQAVRQNANGVDLNRNFPSEDWNATAVAYWQESTGSNPRRFPGSSAGSEPEVRWVVDQIIEYQPDVIVSVHAPYHLLDFDGPAKAPRNIGELYLHQLGVYPGSLGNYAGLNKSIPVVTLELPSAGIMPKADQISLMWTDLVAWLDSEGRNKQQASTQTASAAN
jgi:murein peptide amidase A